jgi:hypothetical protein
MSTTWSEDSPERKTPAEVDATPVEGLDREPKEIVAKVVDAPEAKPVKKSTAKPSTKSKG